MRFAPDARAPCRPRPVRPAAGWVARLGLAALAAGCASTTAPLPPPAEFLVVASPGDGGLTVMNLTTGTGPAFLPIGEDMPADARPIAARQLALVSYARGDSLAVVNVQFYRVEGRLPAGTGAGALGGAIVNDTLAWVALSGRDAILRVHLGTGETLAVPAGRSPVDIVQTRGRLFVVNASLAPCPPPDQACPDGPGWITVHDPATGARLGDRDSIPLPGPGQPRYATVGADGRIYVMSVGSSDDPLGRLTMVDPVNRVEAGSFGGFGERPGQIAADRGERILVSSWTEGLMEFNTRTRSVVRGAGAGLPVATNAGVAVSGSGRIFGIEAGSCAAGAPGRAREYRADLTEVGTFTLGTCAAAAAAALIPVEAVAAAR